MRLYAADIDLDPAWRAAAACRGCDPALWYPERGDHGTIDEAKAVCRTCPVAGQCLDYALTTGETHGIWGGLTERQRRRLRRVRSWRCRVKGCDGRVRARRLCHTHYQRWWRTGRVETAA